jgi:hypothetical protein
MANLREAIRMTVTPNIAENMSDEKRYIPLKNLVGPFSFPMKYFQRRLQIGNQYLGDFAPYRSDERLRAQSFNHKRLLDVFIRMFEELFFQEDESKRKLEARYAYCLVRTHDRFDHSEEIRSHTDLSESYELVESFVFFVEVCRRANEEYPDDDLDFSDLDDIVESSIRNLHGQRKSTGDEQELKRRKLFATKLHASFNCQHPNVYDCTKESCDLSTFTNPVEFGRVVQASGIPVSVSVNKDSKSKLSTLDYAPSKIFNAYEVFTKANDEGADDNDRMPMEFCVFHEDTGQWCLDLCKGLSFDLEPPQLRLELFPLLGFPDIRQRETPDSIPYPDDTTLLRASGVELDNTFQVEGVSGFTRAKNKLALSISSLNNHLQENIGRIEENFETRREWQKRALVVYKSLVYGPRSAVSKSVKNMIHEWEKETEKERRCGSIGIDVTSINDIFTRYPNLDAQQNYLANLFVFAERAGVFCQHCNFLGMLIDSRYACRKGSVMKDPAPHTILYGSPGSGKSYCLEMTKECTQREGFSVFCKWIDNASALNWAVVPVDDPDNPDTTQAQICIMWDEVPGSKLGVGDKKMGEGSNEVSTTKSMLTKATLEFERNTEIKRPDGTVGRGLEQASITNECVIFGGMNRPPLDLNSAFHRRFAFKAALAFDRADGVTLEDSKRVSENFDPLVEQWKMALRINARLHMLVAGAEYCGIIKEPCLKSFDRLSTLFKKEVLAITTVEHFSNRINDARQRLKLFTRMIAIFETYQQSGDTIMRFDRMVSMIPEVERRSVAGDRLALAMLSGIEETIFPLIHKLVLKSIMERWKGDDNEGLERFRADGYRDLNPGRYAKLPLEKKPSYRQKKEETILDCGVRVLMDNVERFVNRAAGTFCLEGATELAKAAIRELTRTKDPELPVIVFEEETGEAGDYNMSGELAIYVSLKRLQTIDISVADIIKKFSPPGTQLTLIPHRMQNSSAILPQFPLAFDDGEGGRIHDEEHFRKRCEEIFVAPDDSYHPTKAHPATTNQLFPKTLIETTNLENL